jgi:hypothetical protein
MRARSVRPRLNEREGEIPLDARIHIRLAALVHRCCAFYALSHHNR